MRCFAFTLPPQLFEETICVSRINAVVIFNGLSAQGNPPLTHGKWQVRNVTGEQITGLPSPHSPFSYVILSCTICSEAPTGRLDTQCGTSSISTPVTKLRQRKTRLPAAGDPDLLSLDISTSTGAAHNTAWLIRVINGYWAWKCTFLPLCLFIYQSTRGYFCSDLMRFQKW